MVRTLADTVLTNVSGSGRYGLVASRLTATLTKANGAALEGRTVSFTVDGTLAGEAVTGANGVATLDTVFSGKNVGSYEIAASFAGDDGDALAASEATGTLTLVKAGQSITFSSSAPTDATGGGYMVGATASSGLSVSFASTTTGVCTVSGNTVSFASAGTCTCSVQASQAGDTNYNPAESVSQSFTVGSAEIALADYVIDFRSSTVGHVIWSASLGRGITNSTGKNASKVGLYARRSDKSGNVAMVTSSDRHLIISKNGTSQTSYARGGSVDFGFNRFGTSGVSVETLEVKNTTTTGGTVSVYRGSTLLKRIGVPKTGSGIATLSLNVANATFVRVALTGPGAVDDVVFTAPQ